MTVKELQTILNGLVALDAENANLKIFSECGHGSGVSDSVDAYLGTHIYNPDEIEGGELIGEEAGLEYFPIFVG